jgi:hypothetical protein
LAATAGIATVISTMDTYTLWWVSQWVEWRKTRIAENGDPVNAAGWFCSSIYRMKFLLLKTSGGDDKGSDDDASDDSLEDDIMATAPMLMCVRGEYRVWGEFARGGEG